MPKTIRRRWSRLRSTKLKAYLSLSNPEFRKWVNMAQNTESSIGLDTLDTGQQRASIMLQSALVGLCEGPALSIVNRIEDNISGFESWRLLWQRYRPMRREKATARVTKILEWVFDKKRSHQLIWRLRERDQEIWLGANNPISRRIQKGHPSFKNSRCSSRSSIS